MKNENDKIILWWNKESIEEMMDKKYTNSEWGIIKTFVDKKLDCGGINEDIRILIEYLEDGKK